MRQALWTGAITAVHRLAGLAQMTISARILGPEGFGSLLAVVIALATLIHNLLSAPGHEAVTTFVTRALAEEKPQEASRILRFTMATSLGLSLIAYALIAIVVLVASSLLGIDNTHRDIALLYGVIGIIQATRAESLAILRLSDRVSMGLAVALAGAGTRVALLGVVLWNGGGVSEVVLAHLAGVVVGGAGLLVVATVSAPRAGIPGLLSSLSLKVPPDVVRFQTGIFGRQTLRALAYNLDTLLVAQFAGAADVGLYRAAKQITDSGNYPFRSLGDGLQLQYSKHWYSGQGSRLRRTSRLFSLVSFGSAAALFGLLAVFHQPVTRFLLGEEFSGAAPLLLIMLVGAFAINSVSALTVLPAAVGRVWPLFAAELGGLAAAVVVIVWQVPLRGAEGAAWANTTYYGVIALILVPFVIATLRQSRRLRQTP